MIVFHKAGKSFGNAVALQPTDLQIAANKTTVLVGLSGSGKSTILRLISGLIEPTAGWIEINGKKLTRAKVFEIRRSMGYVIQSGDLFPHLTARRNILLVAQELQLGMDEMTARVEELCALTRFPGTVGVPSSQTGEMVKIYVVKRDASLNEATLIAHCRKHLTAYKVPKLVEFRAELPKSNVGKILRRVLRDESVKPPAP